MISIAHLYPYELDLYGENGNLKALTYELDKRGIEYKLTLIDYEDKIDFKKYDFIYLGSGRKKHLDIIKERLTPYKSEILDYINKDKILLVTGNALSIFDFLNLYEIKYYEKRLISNVSGTTSLCNGTILGFQNTEYLVNSTSNLLFNLEKGYGNNDTLLEGYNYKNFYVTSLIGPILARNSNLNNYFVDLLISEKNN